LVYQLKLQSVYYLKVLPKDDQVVDADGELGPNLPNHLVVDNHTWTSSSSELLFAWNFIADLIDEPVAVIDPSEVVAAADTTIISRPRPSAILEADTIVDQSHDDSPAIHVAAEIQSSIPDVIEEAHIDEALRPYLVPKIPSNVGCVTVVRQAGCTIRSGVSIDNSQPIMSCRYEDVLYYDLIEILPADDSDTIAVNRLHVYCACPGGGIIHGWASQQGRLIDDQDLILDILYEPDPLIIPPPAANHPQSVGSSAIDMEICPICEQSYGQLLQQSAGRHMNMESFKEEHLKLCMQIFMS
jgi:hypothetical protein